MRIIPFYAPEDTTWIGSQHWFRMFIRIVEKKKNEAKQEDNTCSDINHSQLSSMLYGRYYNGWTNSHGSNALSSAQDIID